MIKSIFKQEEIKRISRSLNIPERFIGGYARFAKRDVVNGRIIYRRTERSFNLIGRI